MHTFYTALHKLYEYSQSPTIDYSNTGMASSSNPKKRVKQMISSGRFHNDTGHLENWFAVALGQIDTYLMDTIERSSMLQSF